MPDFKGVVLEKSLFFRVWRVLKPFFLPSAFSLNNTSRFAYFHPRSIFIFVRIYGNTQRVKLSSHIGSGAWAMVDKSLPMFYGAAFLLVARQMDMAEFGVWVDFQLVWMVFTWFGDNFILQPMVKLASDHKDDLPALFSASFLMYGGFLIVSSAGIWLMGDLWRVLLHSPELPMLMRWMSAMLLGNFLRNLCIRTLQIDYAIVKIVWMDVAFYGVVIGVILLFTATGGMHDPVQMMYANVAGAVCSSALGVIFARKKIHFRHAHPAMYRSIYRLGIYQGGTGSLLAIQTQMDGLLVGLIRTTEEVAIYQVAKTFFRAFEAIRDGANLVILPMSSTLHAENKQSSLVALCEKLIFIMFVVIIPAVFVLILGSQFLMDFIYHGKYEGSVSVLQIFTLGGLALPMTIIGTNIMLGIGQTQPLFRITLINTVIFLLLMVALTIPFGSAGAAWALTIASFLYAASCMRGTQQFVPFTTRGVLSRAGDLRHFIAAYFTPEKS